MSHPTSTLRPDDVVGTYTNDVRERPDDVIAEVPDGVGFHAWRMSRLHISFPPWSRQGQL